MFDNRGTWNEERVAQLKRFHQAGLTSSQIAREIGVTRNAVIGKINRLGLSRPRDVLGKKQRLAMKPPRERRPHLPIFAQKDLLTSAFPAEPAVVEDIPILGGRGCTLLELGHGKCRWPIERPDGKDALFCGNEPVDGLPYCAGHARLAYRPGSRQRSAASG